MTTRKLNIGDFVSVEFCEGDPPRLGVGAIVSVPENDLTGRYAVRGVDRSGSFGGTFLRDRLVRLVPEQACCENWCKEENFGGEPKKWTADDPFDEPENDMDDTGEDISFSQFQDAIMQSILEAFRTSTEPPEGHPDHMSNADLQAAIDNTHAKLTRSVGAFETTPPMSGEHKKVLQDHLEALLRVQRQRLGLES